MSNEATPGESQAPTKDRSRTKHWLLFWMGALLFLVGPALYFLQIRARHLWMPWYVPSLASLGLLLMVVSIMQRRGFVRLAGTVLFGLLCAMEWFILVVATRSPAYEGPALPDRKVPAFVTTLADGSEFSNQNLADGQRRVLVFFRGRW